MYGEVVISNPIRTLSRQPRLGSVHVYVFVKYVVNLVMNNLAEEFNERTPSLRSMVLKSHVSNPCSTVRTALLRL